VVVSNPLELYTVYLGWREYDVIWQACIAFGLAWLPFLGLFFTNLTKPFESAFGHGTETSFRRVFIEFIMMCFVIMVCVYPWVNLETSDVTYKPYCSSDATQSTVGNSGTTYDNVFQSVIDQEVKVPGLYAFVMSFASGFTNALIAGAIPCQTNINQMMHQVVTSRLPAKLQQQIGLFNQECYLNARASFDAQDPPLSSYQSTLKAYGGETDLDWMGSHVLGQLYYPNLRATSPVPPFPYSSYPNPYVDDAVSQGQVAQNPQYGYPTCQQWWSDSTYGLETRIVQAVDGKTPQNSHLGELPLSDRFESWVSAHHLNLGSSVTADDIIARAVLYDSKGDYGGFATNNATVDTDSGLSGSIAQSFVGFGQTMKEYFNTPLQRDGLATILPIMQAIVFFFVLVFMPLILIFGNYRLSVCFSMAFIIFTLIFCNFLWFLLDFLQNALLSSLFDPYSGNYLGQHSSLVNFLNIMFIGVVVLLMGLMSMAGIKIGAGLERTVLDAGNASSDVAASGKEATGVLTGLAKAALLL